MGIVENPLFWGAVGSGVQWLGDRKQNRQQTNAAMGLVQNEPTYLESLLRSQFNVGQDGIMQMLRSTPGGAALNELSLDGGRADASELFARLQPVRDLQLNRGLASLRARAPGLGSRFGSAMMRGEENLVNELLTNYAAQDAQTELALAEGAQNRRLQASQVGSGMMSSVLNLLGNLESQRLARNAQAVGLANNVPTVNQGQPFQDVAQLMLLNNYANQNRQPQIPRAPAPIPMPTAPNIPYWNSPYLWGN